MGLNALGVLQSAKLPVYVFRGGTVREAVALVGREVVPQIATIVGDLSQPSRIEGIPYDATGSPGPRSYGSRGRSPASRASTSSCVLYP